VTDLADIARRVVERAADGEQVEAFVARSHSTSVRVYEGQVEALTSGASYGVGIRVIVDGREGFASAGSLDPDVVAETFDEARANAAFAEPDEWAGLAEPDGVAQPDLDLDDGTAVRSIGELSKIDTALDLEARVRAADPRITSVRTTTWGDGWGEVAIVSTTGIDVESTGGSCSVATSPLASDGDETQIGYAVDAARRPEDLDIQRVVDEAADRATAMLGATKPPSERLTVVLERPVVAAFLGIVSGMLSGDRVVKGRSPFAERLGEVIATPDLTLVDDPTDDRSLGADRHDGEGLATRRTPLIVDGVLQRFLHNSYTGRRAQAASTGSGVRGYGSTPVVGAQALQIAPGPDHLDQAAVLGLIGNGFLVQTISGLHSGVNPVSGDFSVGVAGHRVRDGARAEPHREATIGSTLQRMLLDVVAIGGDLEWLAGGTGAVTLAIADVSLSGA
jgi:PmbA protein